MYSCFDKHPTVTTIQRTFPLFEVFVTCGLNLHSYFIIYNITSHTCRMSCFSFLNLQTKTSRVNYSFENLIKIWLVKVLRIKAVFLLFSLQVL